MKKIFITILLLAMTLSILTFSACDLTSTKDTLSDTQNEQSDNPNKNDGLVINYNTLDRELYTAYDLGSYYGTEFQLLEVNRAYYKLLYSYDETKALTQYGSTIRKEVFNDSYIMAIELNMPYEVIDIVGFTDFTVIDGEPTITLLRSNTNYEQNSTVYYVAIPKEKLDGIWHEGYIDINRQKFDYIKTRQIVADNSYKPNSVDIQLIKREELKDYIESNNLNITIESIKTAPSYIVCYSRGHFDTLLAFNEIELINGKLNVSRNYNSDNNSVERAFLDIIPLEYGLDEIKEINLKSYELNCKPQIREIKINNVGISEEYLEYYPTFDGGVYYGTELFNMSSSSFKVISTYEGLKELAEKYPLDEAIFRENGVLVLKWENAYENYAGFTNLRCTATGWSIQVDKTHRRFLKNEEQVVDLPKEEYIEEIGAGFSYIYLIVPKAILNSMPSYGYITVKENEKLKSEVYTELYEYETDLSAKGVKEGDAWYLSNGREAEAFEKRYGIKLERLEGRSLIVIYLNENEKLFHSTVSVDINSNKINIQLLRNITYEADKELSPHLLIIYAPKSNQYIESNLELNVDILNLKTKAYEASAPMKYTPLSFKTFDVGPSNKLDFASKLLTDFEMLEELFSSHLSFESASEIYSENVFDSNYILALYIEESHTGAIKKDFYNLRIGGNKTIYIYATPTSSVGGEMICETLYLIEVPKSEELLEYNGVVVQETYDYIVSGPFEFETIASTKEKIPIIENFKIINSFDELRGILENYEEYEKLSLVDFENSFILAFNRGPFYDYHFIDECGDFMNFVISPTGMAALTFMYEPHDYLSDGDYVYTIDLVIIPRKHLTKSFEYLTVVEKEYPTFVPDLEMPDLLE